jgi:hypothetical protein
MSAYISLLIKVVSVDDVLILLQSVIGRYEQRELFRLLLKIIKHARALEHVHELIKCRPIRVRVRVQQGGDVIGQNGAEHAIYNVYGSIGNTIVGVDHASTHCWILCVYKLKS